MPPSLSSVLPKNTASISDAQDQAIASVLKPSVPLVLLVLRLGLYTLLLACTVQWLLSMAADTNNPAFFDEGHAVEWLQLVMILTTSLLMLTASWKCAELRGFLRVLAAVAGVAVCRELDSDLDRLLPGGWELAAGILLLWGGWQFYKARKTVWQEMWEWLCTPASGIIWAGTLMVIVFAQIMGQANKWRPLLGENYTRHIKRLVEESSETFGYMLLLFGAIETAIWAWRKARRTSPPSPKS